MALRGGRGAALGALLPGGACGALRALSRRGGGVGCVNRGGHDPGNRSYRCGGRALKLGLRLRPGPRCRLPMRAARPDRRRLRSGLIDPGGRLVGVLRLGGSGLLHEGRRRGSSRGRRRRPAPGGPARLRRQPPGSPEPARSPWWGCPAGRGPPAAARSGAPGRRERSQVARRGRAPHRSARPPARRPAGLCRQGRGTPAGRWPVRRYRSHPRRRPPPPPRCPARR